MFYDVSLADFKYLVPLVSYLFLANQKFNINFMQKPCYITFYKKNYFHLSSTLFKNLLPYITILY